ncbi:DUF1127 domain-containing protein [Microbaculum marinum]|uniref:DUF1127 domain-containing protein n=1 Tax=Microbaculum marinum TaxID=1764581 RepID=A0AAW9RGY0_9HYPH
MTSAEYFGAARPGLHRPLGDALAAGGVAGIVALVADAGAGVCRRLSRWRKLRRAVGELGRLDDRMLKDIGLSRSSLYASARDGLGIGGVGHEFR